tara:strand:- start:819 stop:1490 length:672 start_codon:yes stop_codon:yes gene_type:complete
MTEIVIRNKEMLATLDKTVNMFLEHRELCNELADNLNGTIPVEEWEKFCQEDYLHEMIAKGADHQGFPERGFGFQVSRGATVYPEVFEPLKNWTKTQLPMMFGARSNSLTSYYPPNGFVGWHTNWNACAYQIIFTWSEEGDGYFSYYDRDRDEIITEPDVKGWQARWYRFGRLNEPKHHCWHTAWTNCPRFTLAFKYPYNHGLYEQEAYDALMEFVEEIELST